MDESDEVTIVERCMIGPCTQTNRQELFLSSMDLMWTPFHYNRRLLFYSTPGGHPQQDAFISSLKHSLAMVLVPFYPAAGRLAHMSTHSDKRVCIDCNDAGVEFLVATAALPQFNDLQADNFQPCPFFNKLAPYDVHPSSEIFNLPLLSIQVTRLSFEGLALGFAHSHVLADGHSIWHFMNSWAECARKEAISMPPLHMRTAFAVEKPSEKRAALRYPPEGLSVSESASGPPVASKEPLNERYFQCSAEMIQRLKDEANGMVEKDAIKCKEDNKGEVYSFTSYEAMCAHWWKRVTRARGLQGEQVVRFGVFADMRSRVSPKLPPSYFGNAVIPAYTYAPALEILQESLACTAARVHEASTIAASEDSLWGSVHWLELHGHTLEPKFFSHAPGLRTVSSPRFRVYDVDYGYGRPIAARTARTKGDGEMVLFPSPHGHKGGVEICVPLTIRAMENLLQDPSLFLLD